MPRPLSFPWLNSQELRRQADEFLSLHYPSLNIPIPIELIVERAGIDIVPVPGLRDRFEVDAVTNVGGHTIWVDRWLSEERENRYRFTLAHEMGHIQLHSPVFRNLLRSNASFERCADVLLNLPHDVLIRIEYQAKAFAGLVLVPRGALAERLEGAMPFARGLYRRAIKAGMRPDSAAPPAWEGLCETISASFSVSSEVIRRRLEFEGRSLEELGRE